MIKVNALTNSVLSTPKTFCVMIMCPVDDTGKNSVKPSTMAMMMVSQMVKSPITNEEFKN